MSSKKSLVPSPFTLERFAAQYEFCTPHLLCCSDAEAWSMSDVIKEADDDCKSLWDNLDLIYTHSQGHPLLLKEIAALHNVNVEDITVGAPQECIYIGIHSIVEYLHKHFKTDKIHTIVTCPAYQSLTEIVEMVKCDVSHWQAKRQLSGEWNFLLSDLKSLIRDDTRLLILNFPHNPTGFYPDEDEWNSILNLCKERGIFIFSDEIYIGTQQRADLKHITFCAHYENAMTMSGMSKSFGMPGIRIGWLCCQNKGVMQFVTQFKDYVSICPPAPSEILALIGLRRRSFFINRTNEIVAANILELEQFVKKHSDVLEWHKPRSSTVTLATFKGWLLEMGEGQVTNMCRRLAEQEGIMLFPSAFFNTEDVHVRFGIGRRAFPAGLAALGQVIDKWRKELAPQ